MKPVTDLSELLRSLQPVQQPGRFVFATVPRGRVLDTACVQAFIRETEGLSVVVSEEDAQRYQLPILLRCAWITLSVHSDLAAIGLTAAVAQALSEASISCNVIAGACHDHLFVPLERAQDALQVLSDLQTRAGES